CTEGEHVLCVGGRHVFFFSSRRRHTRSVSAFLLNRSSDLGFMVWSNFTATKCRGLVSLNQVIKEIMCFQSVQLLQWNSQVKFNVTVYRNLPTTRDSIMTS